MPRRVFVCKVGELPPGGSRRLVTDPEPIAVFHVDGRYFACSDACPHAGGPLHQGYLEGASVSCPWHGWNFPLEAEPGAPKDGVDRYPVVVVDGEILVELPD